MCAATNKHAYIKHQYSGPPKSRKKILASLKRQNGNWSLSGRFEAWRKEEFEKRKMKQNEQLTTIVSHTQENATLNKPTTKTYSRAIPRVRYEATMSSAITGASESVLEPAAHRTRIGIDWPQPQSIEGYRPKVERTQPNYLSDITTGEENIEAETDIKDFRETDEQLFSWQRDSEINCDDFDVNQDTSTIVENVTGLDNIAVKTEFQLDDSLCLHGTESQTVEQVFKASDENDVHEGYRCDMCSGPIHRFRYSCVECANYDLCSACEASRGHPQHYLLRIPRPRPHGEIQLIMDTIRRFLTADLKSLRTEANFVDTLINEMKSEVSIETGSDPVPDEPDYPVQTHDKDGEMEKTINTHSQEALEIKDEFQDRTWLDEDILQDSEPQEISDHLETIENNPNTISTHTTLNLNLEHPHRPEIRKVYKTDKVTPPITLGKVKKRVLINMPKKVYISNDVLELIKAQGGDPTERTINIIKQSLQSNVSIRVQRLSKEGIEAVTHRNKCLFNSPGCF